MNYRIDLHTHTNFSDGVCSPMELITDIGIKFKSVLKVDDPNYSA
ncbi:hypothetical protein UT300005_02490 [Clostridium sp. CTA-5]